MIATTTLRAEPASPAVARRFVADALINRGFPDAGIEQAVLLTSELVTNAIVRAEAEVRLVVVADPHMARVEVHEERVAARVPAGDEGIRSDLGLRVVEALSEAWGVDQRDGRSCVWFEVRP